ncbi:MAG: Asp-tRNA(Asn)/Glu-tRNA(Gln) amidotransferase subunit GatB [Dehalococcoidia bacterium]|nr:Asp-tRNA(Asn)/Glu-tRNA(Gln) amidotransferase subunit GatB [Dehalococcoidia bacterium]
MDWEPVIGLEVHAQLLTRSKMFCSCPTDHQQSASPNTRVCPVCLGMPGTLPVINRRAVEFTVMTGMALNCSINSQTHFDRKNYPYPDLMKGYQISQFPDPIAFKGWLDVESNGRPTRVGITRVHLEEDTAKMMHVRDGGDAFSLVDVNRSGTPLMEVVSEPDLRSAETARLYLMKLRAILRALGVSTADMEKGSFRCDANVSLRPKGATQLSPFKVEVKNMNSFRSVTRAIQFEIERQTRLLNEGGRVTQETRGWLDDKGVTVSQRSKEHAHDYRYFPEPDLTPLELAPAWLEDIKARLPELPEALKDRFVAQYSLPDYDARLLSANRTTAQLFERCLAASGAKGDALRTRAKTVSNWTLGELARLTGAAQKDLDDYPEAARLLWATAINQLADLVEAGKLSSTQAKAVFEEAFTTGRDPKAIVQEKGLAQVSEAGAVMSYVEQAIAANQPAVADYLSGKETAVKFLVGQVMKMSKGKANPALVNTLLAQKLEALKST